MKKQVEINVPELLQTAGQNLSIIRDLLEANKTKSEANDDGRVQIFKDLLTVVEQLQIVHFAMNMISDERSGDIIRGASYAPNVGEGFAGQLIDSLIPKIQPGDTLQSFAAREVAGLVETVHTFQIDESGKIYDTESAIAELVLRGENPYSFLIDSVLEGMASAEKTVSESRLLSPEDFHRDAQAFVGGAMGYQHAVNLLTVTPEVIKRLEAYRAA